MKLTFVEKAMSEAFAALGGVALHGPFNLTGEEKYDIIHALVEARQLDEEKENPSLGLYPAAQVAGGCSIGHVFGSPLGLAARTFGIRKRDLVLQRAKDYGYDTMFGDFDHKKSQPLRPVTLFPKDYPLDERYFPDKILMGSMHYVRTGRILLTGPDGRVAGCLAGYTSSVGRTILIPGKVLAPNAPETPNSIYKYTLAPGGLPLPYPLWNEHKLECFQDATVFLCEDALAAVWLDNIIEDAKRFEPGTFVAAALTTRFKIAAYADYRGLWRKHVVFIPSPNRRSHGRAHEMEGLCHKVGCASFSVLPAPVLFRPGIQVESVGLPDPWEQNMAANALFLADEDSSVLLRLKKLAVPIEAYEQWGISVGLFIRPTSEQAVSTAPEPESVPFTQPGPEAIARMTSSEIRMDAVASRKEVGAIIADSGVGKTQFAVSIVVGRVSGREFLHFDALAQPDVVLYVDGEGPGDRLKMSCSRAAAALGVDPGLLEKRLFLRNFRDETHEKVLDLAELYLQGLLEADIRKRKATLVVLDNLVSLTPGFRRKGGPKWEAVWAWMRKMEELYGVAFLIVHHSNGDGDGAGTKDIKAQCMNIITLEDPRKQKKGSTEPAFEPSLAPNKNGVLLRAAFSKCKRYPHLEGKPFGAYLAYEPETPTEGPPWEFIDLEAEHPSSALAGEPVSPAPADETTQRVTDPAVLWPDRTEKERSILQHAAGTGQFTRKDVESLLGYKATKAGDLLRGLSQAGLLDKFGDGRSAYYEYAQR